MSEESKKAVWMVFAVAAFLFITIFFILPYLVQVSVYFHERAHMKALDKHGVESSYSFNLLETIPNFFYPKNSKLGVTKFNLEQYNKLDKSQRAEIHISGITSDLKFLFLIGIYLSFINVYFYYKIKIKQEPNLVWALAINWILFMWVIALIQITLSNITHSSGDIYKLVEFLQIIP